MNDKLLLNKEVGKILKNELMKIIKNEDIDVKKTYEYSFQKNSGFHFMLDKKGEFIKKVIALPKFTDDDDLVQSVIIAHELGHYFVYKKSSHWKRDFLLYSNIYLTYYNEKKAWDEGQKLLIDLGYWENESVKTTFKSKREASLASYKPNGTWTSHIFNTITKPIIFVIKLLFFSYLTVALLINLGLNEVPIPFFPDNPEFYKLSRTEFFRNVQYLFWNLLLIYLSLYYLPKKLLKILWN